MKILRFSACVCILILASVAFAQSTSSTGELDAEDPVSDDGAHYESHTVTLGEDDKLLVTMKSENFDTYLTLKAPDGQIVETNDDGDYEKTGTNSALEHDADQAGVFTILATSLYPESRGAYTIEITIK